MRLIAITGSIGCGKTTIARMIREEGYTVFDVDAWVRRLYFNREFINRIREVFPGTVEGWTVDKRKLRNIVFNDRARLKTLEEMTHPFLRRYLKSAATAAVMTCFFLTWRCFSRWDGKSTATGWWWPTSITKYRNGA